MYMNNYMMAPYNVIVFHMDHISKMETTTGHSIRYDLMFKKPKIEQASVPVTRANNIIN